MELKNLFLSGARKGADETVQKSGGAAGDS